MQEQRHSGYSSFFWPTLLIGVGVIWLLKNLGIVSGVNFSVLFKLWPLLLVVIGLDLLFGRRSPALGAMIGLVTAAIAIGVILISPVSKVELNRDHFVTSAAGVETAQVELGLSVGTTTIGALSDSTNLIEADVTYLGQLTFDERGEQNKRISLTQRSSDFDLNVFDTLDTAEQLRWDVELNRNVPIELSVAGNVGRSDLDFSQLTLTKLVVNGGVGETIISLPPQRLGAKINADVGHFVVSIPDDARIDAEINGGVGGFNINIEEGAALNAAINADVGNFVIDVPQDAAVRVEAAIDLGSITVPDNFKQLSSRNDGPSKNGVWQTDNYDNADRKITIVFKGDIGNLTIK